MKSLINLIIQVLKVWRRHLSQNNKNKIIPKRLNFYYSVIIKPMNFKLSTPVLFSLAIVFCIGLALVFNKKAAPKSNEIQIYNGMTYDYNVTYHYGITYDIPDGIDSESFMIPDSKNQSSKNEI